VFEDKLEIVIRDQGEGFNRDHLPHAADEEDPFTHLDIREKLGLRAGGYGLLICRGMVDEMHYNDAGNEVTLVKEFRPNSTGDDQDTPAEDADLAADAETG